MDIDEILKTLYKRYKAEDLERIEECLRILEGSHLPWYPDERQQADLLYFPGLAARPWYERAEFPWVTKIENAWQLIRDEMRELVAGEAQFNPYINPYTNEQGWAGWNVYSLYRRGVWNEEHCALCPETRRLIETLPHGVRECMFARLQPGTHLTRHSGGSNVVLTVHLGLEIPADCAIRVESETRTWQEGRCLIFDDSYMHEAWNNGEKTRVVLIWDLWHPDLSAVEIEVMTDLFPMVDKYIVEHNN